MEFTIKNVFNLDEPVSKPVENKDNIINESERTDDKTKRMQQLVSSFENKHEVIKEDSKKVVDDNILSEEVKRLNKLLKHRTKLDEYENSSVNQTGMVYGGSVGQTVTNFFPNQTFVKKFADLAKTELSDAEALEIAVKRTLKSGTPINNMSFFDEVNYHLTELGFASKMPLDIKNAISQLLQFGTIEKNKVS